MLVPRDARLQAAWTIAIVVASSRSALHLHAEDRDLEQISCLLRSAGCDVLVDAQVEQSQWAAHRAGLRWRTSGVVGRRGAIC